MENLPFSCWKKGRSLFVCAPLKPGRVNYKLYIFLHISMQKLAIDFRVWESMDFGVENFLKLQVAAVEATVWTVHVS